MPVTATLGNYQPSRVASQEQDSIRILPTNKITLDTPHETYIQGVRTILASWA